MHRHLKLFSLTLMTVVLSSCSNMKSMQSMKAALGLEDKQGPVASDNFHGYYKVGDPYEIDGKWYYPKVQPDYDEYGMASWYGPEFHGKKTANGDTFDQNALTAAHKTLPLPSMVRVTNLENNKTMIVMVNDRGPFSRGRVIDLSKRSAQILGFEDKGIARVRVEYLEGHTRRLLADLPKGKESPFPVAAADPGSPVDVIPAGQRQAAQNALGPLNELSSMLRNRKRTVVESTPHDGGKYSHIKIPEVEIQVSEEAVQDIDNIKPNFAYAINDDAKAPRKLMSDRDLDRELSKAPIRMAELASPKPAPVAPSSLPVPDVSNIEGQVVDKVVEDVVAVKSAMMEVEAMPEPDVQEQAVADTKTMEEKAEEQAIEKVIKHYIQAGTYGLKSNAARVEDTLSPLGHVMVNPITAGSRTLYQVRLGPIDNKEIATLALKKVIRLGHSDAMLVSDWTAAEAQ